MAHQNSFDLTRDVPLRADIARWRATRTRRGAPMPAALWAAAVDRARRHGLAATARSLGLDYGALKRHLAAGGAGPPAAAPTFVDLGVVAPGGLGACVLTIDGPRGRRLRVEVADLRLPDLLALVHAAWRPAA
jgi:hypothetical protein